jgi:hypothetical protein
MARLTHAERRRIAPPCSVADCGRPQESLSQKLCEMHLLRLRKYGSLARPPHPCLGKGKHYTEDGARKICAADGCSNPSRETAYCNKHYHRILRYGDPLYDPIAAQKKPCKEAGCDRKTTAAHGYCVKHGRRIHAQKEKGTLKRSARVAVSNAIQSGALARGSCEVCGTAKNVQAHHDDYSKALEVRWLCVRHHTDVHHAAT